MAQFDVYRVKGGVFVVDCQADLLRDLPTRLVAPLRPPELKAPKRLIPIFDVEGRPWAMMTPLLRSIAVRDIESMVASLTAHEFAIKAALDMLILGF